MGSDGDAGTWIYETDAEENVVQHLVFQGFSDSPSEFLRVISLNRDRYVEQPAARASVVIEDFWLRGLE
jgi:hypothetical protein